MAVLHSIAPRNETVAGDDSDDIEPDTQEHLEQIDASSYE